MTAPVRDCEYISQSVSSTVQPFSSAITSTLPASTETAERSWSYSAASSADVAVIAH